MLQPDRIHDVADDGHEEFGFEEAKKLRVVGIGSGGDRHGRFLVRGHSAASGILAMVRADPSAVAFCTSARI